MLCNFGIRMDIAGFNAWIAGIISRSDNGNAPGIIDDTGYLGMAFSRFYVRCDLLKEL